MNKELNLNIDDLFRWKGQVEITDDQGNVIETLYQRVIGDADIQKARYSAIKASQILRKQLKDEESDEYIVNVPIRGDIDINELIARILYSESLTFRQTAELRITEEKVKEPKSDSSLEKQEEYIEKIEKAKKDYELAILEDIRIQAQKMEETLRTKSYDEIFDEFVDKHIQVLCRTRMMSVFDDYATFYGTFKDIELRERRFSIIDDFLNLSSRVKNKLLSNYKALELNLFDIKK